MAFEKLPAVVGTGGARVDLVIHQDTACPGGSLGGFLRLHGGRVRREFSRALVELVVGVRGPGDGRDGVDGGGATEPVPVHRTVVREGLVVPPVRVVDLPFTAGVPFEAPISVLGGRHLPGVRLGLRARLESDEGGAATAVTPVGLRALPVQQRLLCAVERLGFPLRSAACVPGQLPTTRQRLPFRQEVHFGPSSRRPRATGLRVMFVTDERGVDVVLERDGHDGPSVRVSTPFAEAPAVDWRAHVEGLLGMTSDRDL
ncbi:sporulation-control protein [Streptoalloteichus tenebrarius]|uniref:Sporulation-control protein n=1 Tax=Streptoalloteichus tenebrarius (strain ATCC 17920 / DSM 40477 / JCM 4838 / CBS 697.72 / NBRC 16177 / NCIMB 11028 / NRRL B-12390 / A12253. 1 / ISP 5477) TaxID=1933 RepID=A0ABT1I0X6_STRSD|nr:sporulation protein [Streptoalloteichus tenebrarius]MCP2261434.1 sporulation-control protein [Streptoalloteichus tenebrarius]BFF02038.1 hypothetical protein GCM10020241_37130 [Streptoalloteichus tenebrarius]